MDELSSVLPLLAHVLVGAAFVLAGTAKLRRPDAFARSLRGYSWVPSAAQGMLLRTVPPAEVALGVALVTGVVPVLAAALATITLMAFAGVGVATFGFAGSHECGCFGKPTSATIKALLRRNLALSTLALIGATQGLSLEPLAVLLLAGVAVASVLALVPDVAAILSSATAGATALEASPGRRRFLGLAASVIAASGVLALTGRNAEAACSGCGTCSTSYHFIACTGGGCAAYWVRTREYCTTGCSTCGSWQIIEYCGIPGC